MIIIQENCCDSQCGAGYMMRIVKRILGYIVVVLLVVLPLMLEHTADLDIQGMPDRSADAPNTT